MEAAMPMTSSLWSSIQDFICPPTEEPRQTPCKLGQLLRRLRLYQGKPYVLTLPSTSANSPVQEVLLQTITHSVPKFRARAADGTTGAVAGIGIIPLRITTHDRLTLLIATRALSARALQSTTTALAVRSHHVRRTGRAGT